PPDVRTTPIAGLPDDVLLFLVSSRYCDSDKLADFAWSQFGKLSGGTRVVQAISDFVHAKIRFSYADARSTRCASDSMHEGIGVCRDFAHLAIALCRCMNIPARYCTGYLGDIGVPADINPGDFSAWGEVFLGGRRWTMKTGNRLRQQLIDEDTGDPVEAADKGRGYEVDKGLYLRVEDEELDAIAIESSHTIDIDCFVPKSEIDERYVDSPYYLVPENKVALEAFAVIRDAMRGKGMVGLGRVVLSKRERVVMLQPWGKGLLGTTLRFPYEVRGEEAYFDGIGDVQIPKDMLALAEHILDSKAASFDSSKFHDRCEEAIVAMLNEKKAGLPVSAQRQVPRIVA